ncbi:hypothetical protein PsYK624_013650 [Phanerochaete sordida]|uniref:Uncharacterized protein n=1 Tax=Phanerochaete sordida TaxID=48140 RepID=A0A9P3L7P5_9APHY|nr:hypothetical protein PsYK624_013650 [Phanerochaete sordida]
MILLRVFNMLGYAQTAIFSGLRVFAISDRNYYWASLVFALGMTPFGTNLALTAMSSFGYIPEPLVGGCYSVVGQSERTGNMCSRISRVARLSLPTPSCSF